MGLHVAIFKNSSSRTDCAMNGVSARHTELTITNVPGPFEPTKQAPAAKLLPGFLPGTARIVPDEVPEGKRSMFGGNYAATSDSRFTRAVEDLIDAPFYGAVPIHDRVES